MKRNILAILLSLMIPLSFISCSNSSNIENSKDNKVTSSGNTSTTSSENNESEKNTDTEKEALTSIYYYDAVSDKVVYVNKSITFTDSTIINILVDELKKSPNSDIPPSLSSEAKLNSSNLDIENSILTLDFSSNFVDTQNLGSGSESKTLKAICNTFGKFFSIENVVITLDGQPYSSGHIAMNEGEAFKVDLNDTVELK